MILYGIVCGSPIIFSSNRMCCQSCFTCSSWSLSLPNWSWSPMCLSAPIVAIFASDFCVLAPGYLPELSWPVTLIVLSSFFSFSSSSGFLFTSTAALLAILNIALLDWALASPSSPSCALISTDAWSSPSDASESVTISLSLCSSLSLLS